MTTERWPRRPSPNVRCDAMVVGADDSPTAPHLVRCTRLATETCKDPLGHEAWLCAMCAESLEQRGRVRRNPRRRRVRVVSR